MTSVKQIASIISGLTLAGMIGGGSVYGFKVVDNVAVLNTQVVVVDSKANYALEQFLNSLISHLNKLRSKTNKTAYDIQSISDLEAELKRLRALSYGK